MGLITGVRKMLGREKGGPFPDERVHEVQLPTLPDAQALRDWREGAPAALGISDKETPLPREVFKGDPVDAIGRPKTIAQGEASFADMVEEERERLGVINPEHREAEGEHELPVEIKGLPNIGPDGRFLLWSEEGEDGEIHTELQAGYSGVGQRIDASKPLDTRIITTLKEYSPFHSRAWMGEYHYSSDQAVTPRRTTLDARGREIRQSFPFNVPRQVKVHGVTYMYDTLIGQGGMGGAVKYLSQDGEAIVMKVAKISSNAVHELRAIEETTYHAVLNPEMSEDGEPKSPLARNIRRADGKHPDLASERIVQYLDSVYLQTRTESGRDQRAIGTFIEYLPGGSLADQMKKIDVHRLRTSTEQAYHQLLEGAAQDGIDLAEGLVVHHAAGIEHRDMKPDNVMRGADGHLRIIDPGIARGETVRALRGIDEQVTGTKREVVVNGRTELSPSPEKNIHHKLTNDMQGLYTLAVTRGEGFVLPNKEDYSGGQELLPFEDQVEIWNWLRDWQRYQYEPMSAKERKETLLSLVKRLHDEGGLVEKHVESLMNLPVLDQEVGERKEKWSLSDWRPQDIETLQAMEITEKQGMNSSPVEITDPNVGQKNAWKSLAASGELTAVGLRVGTPVYMSPEHVSGSRIEKYKSDVFSLGVLLLERTGLGEVRARNETAASLMHERRTDNCGLVFHEKGLVSSDLREDLDILAMGQGTKESRKIIAKTLLKQKGKVRLMGLLQWMTLRDPADRPTAEEVLFVMRQVKTELGEDGARLRARQKAKTTPGGASVEQMKKAANG